MAHRTSYLPGTFSWVDLATTDPAAALGFYGRLFGWEEGAAPATLRLDGHLVAGLSRSADRSRWVSYVTVADAGATVARARALGAVVLAEPVDVAGAGRAAIVADPQGAELGLWAPAGRPGAELVNAPGALSWNDLLTPDLEAAAAFYRGLFGWEATPVPGGHPYWTIANGGRSQGGLAAQPPAMAGAPALWTAYFGVDDLDAALVIAREAGGELVVGPVEVPAGRFATARDPQRAVFSLVEAHFDE